jgi:hypothetical protein
MFNPVERMNPNEPPEIREWSKTKLHAHLSEQFCLPSRESRGVTRTYLVLVYQNQAFRITRQELLQFESTLTPAENRKTPFYCVSLLYERLNLLLPMLGLLPFAFPENCLPEEDWFSRILRWADRFNVLEAFQRRINGAPPPHIFAARA